jgi:type VI secretion system FHA domain protein
MRLTLTLSRADATADSASRNLDEGGISIGRSPQADWVVADEDRVLSKIHLRIDAAPAGGWTVTDCSTNGVWLNDDERPLGAGRSTALRDRDRLAFGPYELVATLSPLPVAPAAADPFLALLAAEPTVEAPRFALGDGAELSGAPFPPAEPASEPAETDGQIPEDWYVGDGSAPASHWDEAPSSARFVDGADLADLAGELLRALAAIAAAQDTLEAVERDRIEIDPAAVAARLRAAPSDTHALRDATALVRAHQEALLEALTIGQQSLPRQGAASFADLCSRAYVASLAAQLKRDVGQGGARS